jgi:hypothetical protein
VAITVRDQGHSECRGLDDLNIGEPAKAAFLAGNAQGVFKLN